MANESYTLETLTNALASDLKEAFQSGVFTDSEEVDYIVRSKITTPIYEERPLSIKYISNLDNEEKTISVTPSSNVTFSPNNYVNITTSINYTVDEEDEATARTAIVAKLAYNEKQTPPYIVRNSAATVIYRSDKTEFKVDDNLRCPICFSKIQNQKGEGTQTWNNDPIRTPLGLAGERYTGFQHIKKSDFTDIRTRNISNGVNDVTNKIADEGYTIISKHHLTELRSTIDDYLNSSGIAKSVYFNYDEYGQATGTSQTDWTDADLTTGHFHIKALHIEDLRHALAKAWAETWESATVVSYNTGQTIQGDNKREWAIWTSESVGAPSGADANIDIEISRISLNNYLQIEAFAREENEEYLTTSSIAQCIIDTYNPNYTFTASTEFALQMANVSIVGNYSEDPYAISGITMEITIYNESTDSYLIMSYVLPNANHPLIGTVSGLTEYVSSFDNFTRTIGLTLQNYLLSIGSESLVTDYRIYKISIGVVCRARYGYNQSVSCQIDDISFTG